MSKKISSPFEGNSVATAMYDALKREITGSVVFSLSFVGAGLIVFILGLVKYFSISSNIVDSSEHYDAWAWLVIAAVGLLVGAIGLINILKSMVSLGTIGSSAKDAESHASPFQTQKLNRKVTAMNQSQSMKSPGMEGMAEDSGMSLKKKGKSKDKSAKSKAHSELYDKYNPNKKDKNTTKQEPHQPLMEQKFDYGINQDKKLTFADEFLQKNKRDPFAQYRKDLGIKEEPKKVHEPKPQFISSTPNNVQVTRSSPVDIQKSAQSVQSVSGLDLQLPTDQSTVFDESSVSTNEQKSLDSSFVDNEPVAQATVQKQEIKTNNPYGQRREEDDGLFFSSRTQNTTVTQQPQQVKTSGNSANSIGFKVDESYKNKNENYVEETSFNSDKANISSGKYDFSLFEEIEPGKSKKLRTTEQKTEVKRVSESNKNVEPLLAKTIADAPESAENALIFESMFDSEDDNESDFSDSFVESEIEAKSEKETSLSYNFNDSQLDLHDIHTNYTQAAESNVENPTSSFEKYAEQKTTAVPPSAKAVPQSNTYLENSSHNSTTSSSDKYNFEAFEERPREKTPTTQKKQSFSTTFLNKQKSRDQLGNSSSNSEICTNGTRSQRKFVDASEYDEWSCSQCGKVNQEYVGVCACGTRKPRAKRH